MAYKNHQSGQLGIEQLILLYTPSEMQFFLDLHVILIRMCAACIGCGQKPHPRLNSLFLFRTRESHKTQK